MIRIVIFIAAMASLSNSPIFGQGRIGFIAEKPFSLFSKSSYTSMNTTNATGETISVLNSSNTFGAGLTARYSFSRLFVQADAIYRQNELTFQLLSSQPDMVHDTTTVSHLNNTIVFPVKAGIHYGRLFVSGGVIPRLLLDRHENQFEGKSYSYKERKMDFSAVVSGELMLYEHFAMRLSYEKAFSKIGDFVYANDMNSRLSSRENFLTASLVLYFSAGRNMTARKCVRRPEFLDIVF